MAEAASGPTDVNTVIDDKHFVDKHQFELINRVSNSVIILDELLCENVIDQQSFDDIISLHSSHLMMRALFSGPLKSRGVQGKDIFYKILTIYEPLLIADMERMLPHEDIITAKETLFEILSDMSPEELEEFKSLIVLERGLSPMSRKQLKMVNIQDTVKLMVETYKQECLDLTRNVFKKMNRTDLVQRLLNISSEIEEKPPVNEQQLSLIATVERKASIIELLLETLADLSDQDLESFKEILNQIYLRKHCSMWLLKRNADMKDIVFLIVQNYGQQSVEKMKTVLKNMNRIDLVRTLSHRSPGPQKKYSVEKQPSVLIHKVATMAAVKELLLKTFNDLTNKELKNFKWFLQFTLFQRSLPNISWEQMQETNTAEVLVDVLVEISGQKSVDVTMEIFLDMNRTDLVQSLSEFSSGLRESSSAEAFVLSTTEGEKTCLYEHLPALIQKEKTMASLIELLLETLRDLSKRELRNFKEVVLSRFFNTPVILLDTTNLHDIVFIMVQKFGQQAVEKTKVCLQRIRRTDLVQRLSHGSSGRRKKNSADKHHPSLIKKVATVAAVKQLLFETLNGLSNKQFGKFTRFLQLIVSQKNLPDIFGMLTDSAYAVDKMVQAYGQQSVELIRDVLEKINRTDLFQSMALSSTGVEVDHSVVEDRRALFERAAATAAVRKSLLETLKDLSLKEFKKFKWLLQYTYFQRSLPQIQWSQLDWAEEPGSLVDLMMESHGQQSVEVTKDVFMDMNRNDLVQKWSETSSGLKVHQEVTMTSLHMKLHMKLLETLEDLDDVQLVEFKRHLQNTTFKKGFKKVPSYRMRMAGMVEVVMLIVEKFGEQSLEVTREVLENCDLVQRFSNISTGSEVKHAVHEDQPAQHKREVTMTSLRKTLLETLEQLSKGDLEKFKHVLLYSKIKEGLPSTPRERMNVAHRAQIVEVMVDIYGQQSVEVTREAFMKMNRSDLVQRLSDLISSGSKEGSSRSPKLEDCGSLMDSSGWTNLEPEVSNTDADEAPTYSLQSEAGNFECSVSGLRWFCKEKVSFKFQFCSWEEPMERMERMQYMPAGPLIDITVIAGKLDEVYLPHWICMDDSCEISDKFAVLHMTDCGDDVEKVTEVTTSHVKLSQPVFSAKAALIKVGIPVKINCNVLIYKTDTDFLTLHVYLIPRDPGLQQNMDKRNLSYGYKIIRKPHPEMSLKLRDRFILTADLNNAKISPENLKLRYESGTPNFFEVYIENPDANFMLNLTQRNEAQPVWTREIRRGDYQSTGPIQGEHFVDKHRCDLIERVNDIESILDNLLSRGLIKQGVHEAIRAHSTTQEKMRALYCGPLKAGGLEAKDIFYRILEERESCLVKDLKKDT